MDPKALVIQVVPNYLNILNANVPSLVHDSIIEKYWQQQFLSLLLHQVAMALSTLSVTVLIDRKS
jgi:hypothetical protein